MLDSIVCMGFLRNNKKIKVNSFTILIINHNHEGYVNDLLIDLKKFSKYISRIILLHNLIPKKKIYIPKNLVKKTLINFNEKPYGLSKNINQSLKYCNSKFTAIVNPDIRIKKNIFLDIIKNFKQDKKLALVSPLILNKKKQVQDTFRPYPSIINLIKREIFGLVKLNNGKDWLAGMFSVYKTKVLKKFKFDQTFFLYLEDVDICMRLSQKNLNFLLNKKIYVIHFGQMKSRKSIKYAMYHLKSYYHLWKKHGIFI